MPASPVYSTPDASGSLNIPPDLPPNSRKWNREHVKLFFEANQEEYGLDDKDIELIYKNKVRGRHFPKLTREELSSHPYNLSGGAAATVIELIALLIKLPQPVSVVTPDLEEDENLKRKLDEILERQGGIEENVRALREVTVEVYISRVSATQYKSILSYFGMKRIHVQFEVVPANRTVEGFNWSPEKEGAQMDECLAWLRTNITLPEGTQFHSVANNNSFLNYTFGEGGSKYVLKGTTDVVILQNVYIRSRNILGGMQVIVELKKQVGDQDTRQVTLELISANVFSNYGVVVLLTDLNEYWHFLWLTKETRIEEIVLGLHCGVALLEDILHGRGSEEKPYCTRCNMEGIAAATTTTESVLQPTPVQNPMPGQRSTLLPLQKVDPFECVPKPEVGNMEDFFDEMTEFEVKKWKLKHVMDHISQAPGWESMYA